MQKSNAESRKQEAEVVPLRAKWERLLSFVEGDNSVNRSEKKCQVRQDVAKSMA